jgi:flagellar biosynthesis protein FliR
MYEPHRQPLLTRAQFARRLGSHFAVAFALVLVSLAIGMTGYMYFEHLPWRDAFLNSAMLLGGMGPVDPLKTDGGKIFAGIYALYAGLVFLATAGVVFAPVVHRLLHKFHLSHIDGDK